MNRRMSGDTHRSATEWAAELFSDGPMPWRHHEDDDGDDIDD